MNPDNSSIQPPVITPEYLASLSIAQLADLLLNRYRLLRGLELLQSTSPEYLDTVKREIREIHLEIKKRN